MSGQQVEAGGHRSASTRTIEFGTSQHRRGQPRTRPPVRPAVIARSRREQQLRTGERRVTQLDGELCGRHPHGGRLRRPPQALEPSGDRIGLPQQIGWRRGCRHLQRTDRDVLRHRRPAVTVRLPELGEGHLRLAMGSVDVSVGQACPSEKQMCLCQIVGVAAVGQGVHGDLGVRPGFVDQPGRQHQLAPIRREHPGAPAGIADLLVQRIGAHERRQCGDDVSLEPGGERVVVGGPACQEILLVGRGQPFGHRRIVERFLDPALIRQRDRPIAPQSCLQNPVGAQLDGRQGVGVRVDGLGHAAHVLEDRGALHVEVGALHRRQQPLHGLGQRECLLSSTPGTEHEHQGAADLRGKLFVADVDRDRDRGTHVLLGLGEAAQLPLRGAHRPVSDDASGVGHVVAFDDRGGNGE